MKCFFKILLYSLVVTACFTAAARTDAEIIAEIKVLSRIELEAHLKKIDTQIAAFKNCINEYSPLFCCGLIFEWDIHGECITLLQERSLVVRFLDTWSQDKSTFFEVSVMLAQRRS